MPVALARPAPTLAPIGSGDVAVVAGYLHDHLNSRLSPAAWASSIVPGWPGSPPNHGFVLREADDRVVGVQLAFYSERTVAGRTERFCNLGAWCVDDDRRAHGLRLLRAVLAQPGYHVTDLSPSPHVAALDERLGFRHLDVATVLMPNGPALRPHGFHVLTAPDLVESLLDGHDRRLHADHHDAGAVHHLVLVGPGEHCYVMYRRDRRRGLPLFASLLHVGDPGVLVRALPALRGHLARRRVPFLLAPTRLLARVPATAVRLRSPRPKMLRSDRLPGSAVDDLYSELTCVAW